MFDNVRDPKLCQPYNQRKDFSVTLAISTYLLVYPFIPIHKKSLEMFTASELERIWEIRITALARAATVGLKIVHVLLTLSNSQLSSTTLQIRSYCDFAHKCISETSSCW